MDQLCLGGAPQRACEDRIGWGKGYCFVMDGASGLGGKNIMDEDSDAAWFVEQLKKELCYRLDREDPRPTEELLEEIIAGLEQQYQKTAETKGLTIPPDSPSAGIAMFRERNGKLEFYGLGDCVGTVDFADGTGTVLTDTALPELDHGVIAEMIRIHQETGVTVLEARKQCNDLLLENRNKRNRQGGYWILDISGAGVRHGLQMSWKLTAPATVTAFSDGFAQLADLFKQYEDYRRLGWAMTKTPLKKLYDMLYRMQEDDPDANAYPRFKLRDDTCALWGRFCPEELSKLVV